MPRPTSEEIAQALNTFFAAHATLEEKRQTVIAARAGVDEAKTNLSLAARAETEAEEAARATAEATKALIDAAVADDPAPTTTPTTTT